jgi:hypothetical protein
MFQGEIFGQADRVIFPLKKVEKMPIFGGFKAPGLKYSVRSYFDYSNDAPPRPNFVLLNILPGSWYSNCLGFFCKKELQLEKIMAVPIRFRLGSLDYVNYLEQKPNAFKPRF